MSLCNQGCCTRPDYVIQLPRRANYISIPGPPPHLKCPGGMGVGHIHPHAPMPPSPPHGMRGACGHGGGCAPPPCGPPSVWGWVGKASTQATLALTASGHPPPHVRRGACAWDASHIHATITHPHAPLIASEGGDRVNSEDGEDILSLPSSLSTLPSPSLPSPSAT